MLIVCELVAADSGQAIGGEGSGSPTDPYDLSRSREILLRTTLKRIESGNRHPDECQYADGEPYETAE
jgi:hypothetical protein